MDYTLNSRQNFFARYVTSNRLQSKTNAYFLPVSGRRSHMKTRA